MCGRYTAAMSWSELVDLYEITETGIPPNVAPRYNVAPTQTVPIVRSVPNGRELAMVRWGLVPSWSKGPDSRYSMINARAETVTEKPSFRTPFRRRRCLVPADGFYEWMKANGAKQPYRIALNDGRPFAFAGLWDSWESADETAIESCTIIVTDANELVRPIHDRMPVILDPGNHVRWLDVEGTPADEAAEMLRSYPSERMTAYPVSRMVNSPKNDDPKCIEAVAAL